MSQGVTVKGKTTGDQNVPIRVDEQGRLYLNPDSVPTTLKVTNVDGSAIGGSTTTYYKMEVDKSTTTDVIYIGKAAIGTATSTAGWQIKKIDKTVTDNVTITFGAAGAFTAIWDNRGSETYS